MMGNVDPYYNTEIKYLPNEEEQEKEKEEEGGMKLLAQLPEEVLVDILVRLPSSKCVSRSKILCKDLCSLISTTYFTRCYMKHRCQDRRRSFTLVYTLQRGSSQSNIKAVSNHPEVSKMFEKKSINNDLARPLKEVCHNYKPGMELDVHAACDDLMLYSDVSSLNLCALNLVTRDNVVVPPVPVPRRPGGRGGWKPGLLCYPSRGFFKLILLPFVHLYDYPKEGCDTLNSPFSIDMYCSETNKWSVVNVKWYPLRRNCIFAYGFPRPPIVAHDGMLHWLLESYLVSVDPCSAHFQTRVGRVVKLPKKHAWFLLGVCGGNIRVVGRRREKAHGGRVYNVWDLHHNSWVLAHKIVAFIHDQTYLLLAVHPYDPDSIFVIRGFSKMVYLFNMRTNTLDDCQKLDLEDASPMTQASVLLH